MVLIVTRGSKKGIGARFTYSLHLVALNWDKSLNVKYDIHILGGTRDKAVGRLSEKVLFFGDLGIDDIFALFYAYYSENIEVVGVVADYGNVSKDEAVKNARYLQKIFKMDVPVMGGARIPLTGKEPEYYPEIHGLEGLGPLSIADEPNSTFENFFEVAPLIDKYAGNLTLINVGRLTSLASAFVFFPETMKKIKDFYIMGGAFNYPGNVTPVAEANFHGDPLAANIVLSRAPRKVRILPLNVTQNSIITPYVMNYVISEMNSGKMEPAKILKPMYDFYFNAYKKQIPSIQGTPLHDLMTMWAIKDKQSIIFADAPVKVITEEGDAFGQSIADFRKIREKALYPVHKIAVRADYACFVNSFAETFIKGSNRSAK
ncbi:nucleoside hydrolase [Peribacillus sp. B-H-3]|uniref:nucleoside hydrolase n=1 Tax=Peribacillus sp. B-H-3 TaxID=3400420 RepID=UPI003B015580